MNNNGITMIENALVVTGKRQRHDKDFVKIYKLFSEKCLDDFGVINGEFKLLVYMVGMLQEMPLNTDGWIHLSTNQVLNDLKIKKSTYFKYLKSLKELNYIEQKETKTPLWRINPDFIYRGDLVESKKKGKVTNHQVYLKPPKTIDLFCEEEKDNDTV